MITVLRVTLTVLLLVTLSCLVDATSAPEVAVDARARAGRDGKAVVASASAGATGADRSAGSALAWSVALAGVLVSLTLSVVLG